MVYLIISIGCVCTEGDFVPIVIIATSKPLRTTLLVGVCVC